MQRWSHLELQKLGEVHKDTQTDDETEEGHPAERLLEGSEDGAGPLKRNDHNHVDGAGDCHVLKYPQSRQSTTLYCILR